MERGGTRTRDSQDGVPGLPLCGVCSLSALRTLVSQEDTRPLQSTPQPPKRHSMTTQVDDPRLHKQRTADSSRAEAHSRVRPEARATDGVAEEGKRVGVDAGLEDVGERDGQRARHRQSLGDWREQTATWIFFKRAVRARSHTSTREPSQQGCEAFFDFHHNT